MLIKMDDEDWKLAHCKDDPVRPHLPLAWRTQSGREVLGLESDTGEIQAVICMARCDGVPITERELDRSSRPGAPVAVFYTVWSYARGAGRTMVLEAAEYARTQGCTRFVTLSPLTEMAERFHIRNGATLLERGTECQNFEYVL